MDAPPTIPCHLLFPSLWSISERTRASKSQLQLLRAA